MMISEKMKQALNAQVTSEFCASHAYLAMACSFEEMGLKVFSKRFYAQFNEERDHALKLAKYIEDVGGNVVLDAIEKPKSGYKKVQEIIETAVEAEKKVTKQIHDLVALAESEKDYATRSFLQWFVDEQVEEVATMEELLQLVKLAGDAHIFQIEARLAQMMAAGG